MVPLILAGSAMAATYSVELAIPSEHPSWLDSSDLYGASRDIYAAAHSDMTINAGDSRVKCRVLDGLVSVRFAATASNYPTSSFSTSCSYNGDTLEIDVVFMSSETDPSLQEPWIQPDDSISVTRVDGAVHKQLYELPECAAGYVNGLYNSTLSGVDCRVTRHSGRDYVRVIMAPSATMGTGTCTLPLGDNSDYVLTLDLDEDEI